MASKKKRDPHTKAGVVAGVAKEIAKKAFYPVTGLIEGAQQALEGMSEVRKNQPTTIDGKVMDIGELQEARRQGGKKVAAGIAKMIFKQHPEWYDNLENGPIDALPFGLNFAADKASPTLPINTNHNFGSLNNMPQVDTPNLVEASYLSLATFGDHEDDAETPGWQSEIEAIYLGLFPSSGRNPNYPAELLSKFLHNIRVLQAMIAVAVRLYRIWSVTDYSDSSLPDSLRMAAGLQNQPTETADYIDGLRAIIAELTNLFPFECDLFARTRWLFNNVFKDYDGLKPTYMMYNVIHPVYWNPASSTGYTVHEDPFWKGQAIEGTAIYGILGDIWEVINATKRLVSGTTLISDIIRVYGYPDAAKVYGYWMDILTKPAFNLKLDAIYDEYQLAQWQNQKFLYHRVWGASQDDASKFYWKINANTGSLQPRALITRPGLAQLMTTFQQGMDGMYINADPKRLGVNELTSQTRLCSSLRYDSANNGNDTVIYFDITPTEVPVILRMVNGYYYGVTHATYNLYRLGVTNIPMNFFIYGDAGFEAWKFYTTVLNSHVQCDYFPRMETYLVADDQGKPAMRTLSVAWDYANYAQVPRSTMKAMTRRATMSLLVPKNGNGIVRNYDTNAKAAVNRRA